MYPPETGCIELQQCLHTTKRHSCCGPRRTGERKHTSVQGSTEDGCQYECSQLGRCKKKKEKLLVSLILLCLRPKRASRICRLLNPSIDDAHQYVVGKPLDKESKKPRTSSGKGVLVGWSVIPCTKICEFNPHLRRIRKAVY